VGWQGRWDSVKSLVYYVGRLAQLIGMWLLIVDIVTASPLGPNAKLFAAGVAIFLAGWALLRLTR
jgi:hypothetical protein